VNAYGIERGRAYTDLKVPHQLHIQRHLALVQGVQDLQLKVTSIELVNRSNFTVLICPAAEMAKVEFVDAFTVLKRKYQVSV
jgi:hypothetical protein